MPQRLATATDWSDYLKQHNKDISGVSDWKKYFLQPTQQYYQTQAQAVSAQTEYDISGAYQNYLRTQRNLMQNKQLASGFKEQLGEEAKAAYEGSYATAKTKEAASLYDVSKAYTEALAKEDERLLGMGEQLASFEEKLYEFANIDSAYATMAYGQEQKDEAGNVIGTGLGHYEMNPETGEYTLSDRGKAFVQDLLYGETRAGSKSFESYLTDQEETELLSFYRQNQGLINEMFGLDAEQRAPDEELSKSVADKNYIVEINKRQQELGDNKNLVDVYRDLKNTDSGILRQDEYHFTYTDRYGQKQNITTDGEYSEHRGTSTYLNILRNSGIGTGKKLSNGDVITATINGKTHRYLYNNKIFYRIKE